jgi:hypothetical protein
MKFAKRVFLVAGIYGLIILLPQYFPKRVSQKPETVLCVLCFSFAPPARTNCFTLEAQRENVRRKELTLAVA